MKSFQNFEYVEEDVPTECCTVDDKNEGKSVSQIPYNLNISENAFTYSKNEFKSDVSHCPHNFCNQQNFKSDRTCQKGRFHSFYEDSISNIMSGCYDDSILSRFCLDSKKKISSNISVEINVAKPTIKKINLIHKKKYIKSKVHKMSESETNQKIDITSSFSDLVRMCLKQSKCRSDIDIRKKSDSTNDSDKPINYCVTVEDIEAS